MDNEAIWNELKQMKTTEHQENYFIVHDSFFDSFKAILSVQNQFTDRNHPKMESLIYQGSVIVPLRALKVFRD